MKVPGIYELLSVLTISQLNDYNEKHHDPSPDFIGTDLDETSSRKFEGRLGSVPTTSRDDQSTDSFHSDITEGDILLGRSN